MEKRGLREGEREINVLKDFFKRLILTYKQNIKHR